MLDFREYFLHITKDVMKLAKALAKRKLSPPLKIIAIEQLPKSKYHATHFGVFNERQLTIIDGILNKAMRQALGLLPDFPTKGVQRSLKEACLGLSPMRDRATQMGIEHITRVMNKDTEKGFTAHAHVHRLLSQFNHWSQEALEASPLKLPTLRILRLASNIPRLEYDHLPPLQHDNVITTTIRESSITVDNARQEKRTTLQGQQAQRNTTRWFDNNASRYNIIKNYSDTLPPSGKWGCTTRATSSQYNTTIMKTTHYISN
jgi:hypothetical protein